MILDKGVGSLFGPDGQEDPYEDESENRVAVVHAGGHIDNQGYPEDDHSESVFRDEQSRVLDTHTLQEDGHIQNSGCVDPSGVD